jgi:hypothetical protein
LSLASHLDCRRASDSIIARIGERGLAIFYLVYMVACIALIFIVARREMFILAKHIVNGVLNIFYIGDWQTE